MTEMSKEDIRKVVEPIILEYFENRDYDETPTLGRSSLGKRI